MYTLYLPISVASGPGFKGVGISLKRDFFFSRIKVHTIFDDHLLVHLLEVSDIEVVFQHLSSA